MSRLPRRGELDVELHRDARMGLVFGVKYPSAYPVYVNRIVKGYAVGDASSQIGWRWFVKPDDKSTQRFLLTDLNRK